MIRLSADAVQADLYWLDTWDSCLSCPQDTGFRCRMPAPEMPGRSLLCFSYRSPPKRQIFGALQFGDGFLSWKAWNEVKHILLDRYGPTTARKTPTLLLPHYSPGSPLHAWRELDLDGQNEARDHHEIVLRLVAS